MCCWPRRGKVTSHCASLPRGRGWSAGFDHGSCWNWFSPCGVRGENVLCLGSCRCKGISWLGACVQENAAYSQVGEVLIPVRSGSIHRPDQQQLISSSESKPEAHHPLVFQPQHCACFDESNSGTSLHLKATAITYGGSVWGNESLRLQRKSSGGASRSTAQL